MESILLESHSLIHRPLGTFWGRVKVQRDLLVRHSLGNGGWRKTQSEKCQRRAVKQ